MARLIEISSDYEALFDMFDDIDELEPSINENGEPVDDDGNLIDDIDVWHESLKEQWLKELIDREDEFEVKAENTAQYIKNLIIESDALENEIKKMQQRKKSKDNKIKRLKTYLRDCMVQMGRDRIETTLCKLSIRNNAESVTIEDEKAFTNQYAESHKEYFKFKPEISKTEIKKALQLGEEIPGAKLEKTKSVIIK